MFFRHVQVNNECAIEFYQKFGFEIVETREQYYKRIEPAGAHVLEKNLRKSGATMNSELITDIPNGNADTHTPQTKTNKA